MDVRPLPIRIIRALTRRPLLVVSVASIGVRLGRDAVRVRSGKIDSTEFRARAGGHLGAVGGGAVGAMAGAMAGSVLPGLGTILGGFAGGLLGEMAGSTAGRRSVEWAETHLRAARDPDLDPPKRSL